MLFDEIRLSLSRQTMAEGGVVNRESEEQSGSGGLVWIAVIILLPVLYVLSIGPVAVIVDKTGIMPPSNIRRFYHPVIWLHDNTPLRKPLEAYLRLWGFP